MATVLRATSLVPLDGMGPLDFQADAGAIVCLVGEVGLRSAYAGVLAGARYPVAGDMELLGQRLSTLDDRRWLALRRHVGFVTREVPLVSSHDVLRNVMLPALYHDLGNRDESARRAQAWLERLGFRGDLQGLPAFLSERDRRIVALARALMLEPQLLFLDDPLHGLHGEEVHRIARSLGEWCQEANRTLVHATDDAAFMRSFADTIVFITPPAPQVFASWKAFHDSRDEEVQRYFAEFRTEAKAFD